MTGDIVVLDHGALLDGRLRNTALVVVNNFDERRSVDLLVRLWRSASVVVLADGACNKVADMFNALGIIDDLVPHAICGDLDSADPDILSIYKAKGVPVISAPSQDHTDLSKCLRVLALWQPSKQMECFPERQILNLERSDQLPLHVTIFGAFGGRFDHEMSSINALYMFRKWFASLTLLSSTTLACLIQPESAVSIECHPKRSGPTCGLIPIGCAVESVTTSGLQWNLSAHRLEFGHLVSTSNAVVSSTVTIRCSAPVLWTVEINSST
ncbi:Thiamine pyrophosphokinase [Plasmodiophora brassicae]